MTRLQPWTRPHQAVRQLLCGGTVRTCAPIAVVVGTVLSLVNQGDVVATGMGGGLVTVKIAANYLIPFLTSSTGALLAVRAQASTLPASFQAELVVPAGRAAVPSRRKRWRQHVGS